MGTKWGQRCGFSEGHKRNTKAPQKPKQKCSKSRAKSEHKIIKKRSAERLHFTKRLGICLEKEISERCAAYRFIYIHARTRGYKTVVFRPTTCARVHAREGPSHPHFSYDNAHARASGVHLCHLRHIRAVTERIGSGYGADQSASLLYDRGQSGEGERRRRRFFNRQRAHYVCARESGDPRHIFTNVKV